MTLATLLLASAALAPASMVVEEGTLEAEARLVETHTLEIELRRDDRPLDGPLFLLVSDSPRVAGVRSPHELGPLLAGFTVLRQRAVDGRLRLALPRGTALDGLHLFAAALGPSGPVVSPLVHVIRPPRRRGGIDPRRIAVFANSARAQSMDVAAAYMDARRIPAENLRIVELNPDAPNSPILSEVDFDTRLQPLINQLPDHVDLIAISWSFPFKVVSLQDTRQQMSMTSAFLFGTTPRNFVTATSGCETG